MLKSQNERPNERSISWSKVELWKRSAAADDCFGAWKLAGWLGYGTASSWRKLLPSSHLALWLTLPNYHNVLYSNKGRSSTSGNGAPRILSLHLGTKSRLGGRKKSSCTERSALLGPICPRSVLTPRPLGRAYDNGPRELPCLINHRSLYRRSLKLSLDWAVQRNLWRGQAVYIRSLFDANRNINEPRQQRVRGHP